MSIKLLYPFHFQWCNMGYNFVIIQASTVVDFNEEGLGNVHKPAVQEVVSIFI